MPSAPSHTARWLLEQLKHVGHPVRRLVWCPATAAVPPMADDLLHKVCHTLVVLASTVAAAAALLMCWRGWSCLAAGREAMKT